MNPPLPISLQRKSYGVGAPRIKGRLHIFTCRITLRNAIENKYQLSDSSIINLLPKKLKGTCSPRYGHVFAITFIELKNHWILSPYLQSCLKADKYLKNIKKTYIKNSETSLSLFCSYATAFCTKRIENINWCAI